MKVFILCAGESKRWEWETIPKFFVPVFDDQPLLKRTVQQANHYGQLATVVTHRDDVEDGLGYMCNVLDPERRAYTCDTLRSTATLWDKDKTVILLGDVLYSDRVLSQVFQTQEDISFFGDAAEREIYALTFRYNRRILEGIEEVSKRVAEGYHGQLWQLFYSLNNFPPDHHPRFIPFKNNMFIHTKDYTQDFDSVADYEQFLNSKYMNRREMFRGW